MPLSLKRRWVWPLPLEGTRLNSHEHLYYASKFTSYLQHQLQSANGVQQASSGVCFTRPSSDRNHKQGALLYERLRVLSAFNLTQILYFHGSGFLATIRAIYMAKEQSHHAAYSPIHHRP